jgi:hypothetical protein
MNSPSTPLQQQAVAPFTHIFLSLDLMEAGTLNNEQRVYLAIIRQNTERLQKLVQQEQSEISSLKLLIG